MCGVHYILLKLTKYVKCAMSILIRIIQDLNNKIRSHLPAADFYYSSAAGFTAPPAMI